MPNPYETMTQNDFDRCLRRVLTDWSANDMLDIPGVYEVLAKHFNDEVLDFWQVEKDLRRK